MNALPMAFGGLQTLVNAPVWSVLLLKITAILLAAWLAHLALARTNPRWRVFLWRVTAVGLFALPAVAWWLPALRIRVQQPPAVEEAATLRTAPRAPLADRAAAGSAPAGVSGDLADQRPLYPAAAEPSAWPLATSSLPLPQPHALTPAPSESSFVSWPAMFLAVWLAGVGVLAFRLCLGHYRIRGIIRRAQQPPPWIRNECLRVAQGIGCGARVDVVQSVLVQAPLLCGVRRPLLLLPVQMCEDSYRKDLPGIFAHEMAHIRSHDLPWNLSLHLISIVLWFHPLAWRLRKAHLAACELICDAVSATFVGDVAEYCRILARVAVAAVAPHPAAGIAMARTSAIGRRLNILKKGVFPAPLRRRSVMSFGFAAMLAVVVLGALQFALAASLSAEQIAGADQQTATPAQNEGRPPAEQSEETPANEARAAKSADSKSKTESLRVRVVDESGKPLGGTKLKVAFLGHKADYTTDAEGKTTVVAPAANAKYLSIIAYPDGYPPMRKRWRNDAGNDLIPAEFTFAYEQGRAIGGVVRDEQGKPIPGVKVHLRVSSEKYQQVGMCLALWDRVFLTDAQGRWHLGHVPRIDSMAVGLEHPDYISVPGPGEISAWEQQTIEDHTAVMVMKKGLPVSGTVTDPEGRPVANATVLLGEWYSPKRLSVSTDQEGHFRFASLAPGGTVLTVTYPALAPGLRSVNVQSQMKAVDVRLEQGNTLRVRVVGKNGKPIAGVFVTPDTWRGKRVLGDLGIRGRTDAEGRWVWTWAPKDAVETNFGSWGHVKYMSIRHLPLVAREAEHVVTIYPALTISGRVIDAETKELIPRFRVVRGYMSTGSVERLTWARWEAQEGKNGQYKVTIGQPSRIHVVRIEADGHQPGISREFKNDEGIVTYDFSLSKGRDLNVLVRLPDGKPATGADVCLCPEKPGKLINSAVFVKNGRFSYGNPTKLNMTVGADGRLRIEPQDNEFLLIVLHDQGYAQVTSKELIANPQITLQAWARLEGVVRHGSKPAPGAKLDVDLAEPINPRWSFLNFQDQTEADAEGKFVFAKLKPGKWGVRELPVNQRGVVGPRLHGKAVELAAGQTLSITLGGVGRPVVGQIQWPGGKPPEGDLSRIGAEVRPKMPEFPSPPKTTRDQGPDAIRAWMKQWRESEEGKVWQRKVQQLSGCPRRKVSVNRDGALRVEDVVPGRYELGVYVRVTDETLPWDQPQLLHYTYDFSVPEIPGGVSDEPLNLGNVLLVERFPRKPSSAPVKPPAPQAAGEKSVGGLRDHLELLRYIVVTYKENKAKIRTWQGKATVESRSVYATGDTGDDYSATVQFVFDRTRRSVRWNNTLEKWTKITQGQEDPQPVPQIVNGMMTPAALYRLGRHGSPGNPAKRPLMLTIYSSNDSDSFGRMQPQLYDFNPLYYLDTPRGDVARDLAGYLAMADHPGISRIKVIRAGDEVTIDMSMDNVTQRYTVSLSRSCNPIRFETVEPTSTWENHWTYELRDSIWLPGTWTQTIHQKDRRDEQRKVTFVESLVNQKVEPAVFSISRLGLQRGDKVDDRRTGQKYQYKGDRAP